MQEAAGQAQNVIIDLRRCKLSEDKAIRSFEKEFSRSRHFRRMKIIKKDKEILDFYKEKV